MNQKNIIKLLFVFSFVFFAFESKLFGQQLPLSVKQHLDNNYSGWQPLVSNCSDKSKGKWVFQGDFNSDGNADLIVTFRKRINNNSNRYVMAFIKNDNSYNPYTVKIIQNNKIVYGYLVAPFLQDKKDRLSISQCGTNLSELYEFKNGKFILAAQT